MEVNTPGQTRYYKERLAEGRRRIFNSFRQDRDSSRLLRDHCRLVDQVLIDLWDSFPALPGAALVATGGYGRADLFPHADVDLLILLHQAPSSEEQTILEQLVGTLWDIGLNVGHSVRTVADCVKEAHQDLSTLTNLLEVRHLAGDKETFGQMCQAIRATLLPSTFLDGKLFEQRQRHQRYNDTAYNLEPNVKESPGGLRDLHTVIWIARAAGIGQTWQDLVNDGLILPQEARQIRADENLLKTLRIWLHLLAGRREDRIIFDLQRDLAEQMGYRPAHRRQASEILMQRYYRAAKAIRLINEILLTNLGDRLSGRRTAVPRILNDRFQITEGRLQARDLDIFTQCPAAIFEALRLYQSCPDATGFGAKTLRALWRAGQHINTAFRDDLANRAAFMAILRSPRRVTQVLRMMNQYGILGRYLPAFGRIVGQMQHDLFHVYTVDEHILTVARNLRRFTFNEVAHEFPLCSRLISCFDRKEVLYVAALFHDIAKGRGGDHSQLGRADARRFCNRHGMAAEDTDLVIWLVEQHLLMSQVSQKQDLSDPDVIARFAQVVGDKRHLDALYLLTVADIRGTSPRIWNSWKGKLLEDLYHAALRSLSGQTGSLTEQQETQKTAALQILVREAIPDGVQKNFWAMLDETYFLRHEPSEIAWHTRHLNRRVAPDSPVVRARLAEGFEGIQVFTYAKDRPDLFARQCATFERLGFSIYAAKIHTTQHGYALNSFYIQNSDGISGRYRDLLSYIEYELGQALLSNDAETKPERIVRLSRQLKHFPIQPEVIIEPDLTGSYYILSIIAGDRPGLLAAIARVLLNHRVSLHTAKITTLGERAEDSFLLRADNRALEDSKCLMALEQDLLQALRLPAGG